MVKNNNKRKIWLCLQIWKEVYQIYSRSNMSSYLYVAIYVMFLWAFCLSFGVIRFKQVTEISVASFMCAQIKITFSFITLEVYLLVVDLCCLIIRIQLFDVTELHTLEWNCKWLSIPQTHLLTQFLGNISVIQSVTEHCSTKILFGGTISRRTNQQCRKNMSDCCCACMWVDADSFLYSIKLLLWHDTSEVCVTST